MNQNLNFRSTASFTRPNDTTAYTALDVLGADAGTLQVETATASGTITAAVAQVETATAVGTIDAGTAQVETATIVGTITGSGNATVTVTGAGITGSPLAVSVAVSAGVKQVESTTVVGTVGAAGAGDVDVIVTADGMTGSPKTIAVAVANNDTALQVATKIRAALEADADVGHPDTGWFDVSGTGANIVLTAAAAAANDATMNISIADGTSSGVGSVPSSTNTTAGVAPDDDAAVAAKVIAALDGVAAITALYTVGGTGADVTLTRTVPAANDATLNIAYTNGTCTGLTPDASSTNTTAGAANGAGNATVVVTGAALENSPITFSVPVAAGDNASAWAGKVRTALAANENIADAYTVSGATDKIVLTAKSAVANDATLNISLDNGTCTGITTAASSANTTAGVASGAGNAEVEITSALIIGSPITVSVAVAAGDTAATWAGKVRTALNADTRVTDYYTVSGSSASIILTAKTAAANDATLNIALDNGTCTGINAAASSANTTAGAATTSTAGSAILTFSNAGPNGDHIKITDVNLRADVAAVWASSGAFRLHLYSSSPTAIVDNAAFDLPSGDRSKYLGFVDIVAPVDVGATLYSQNKEVNKVVKLALGSTSIYGVLQTIAGFTPGASEAFTVEIITSDAA